MRLHPIVVALAAGGLAMAQQYPFLAVPGSPRNVQSILQDSKGRLWLIPELSCFDGSRFFSLRDYGLPAVTTYDVKEDSSGGLWIATNAGIYRFADGKVEQVNRSAAISVVPIDHKRALAGVVLSGSSIFQDKTLVRIEQRGSVWKTEVLLDMHSPGYLNRGEGETAVFPLTTSQWGEIQLQDAIRWKAGDPPIAITRHGRSGGSPVDRPTIVSRDNSGCEWMGSGQGFSFDCGAGFTPVTFPNASLSGSIRTLKDGRMMFSGSDLFAVGRPGSFQIVTPENGLPAITDADTARDGTIWIASPAGLYRSPPFFRTEYWTAREGVTGPPWSFAKSGSRMYAGLQGEVGVLKPDRSAWTPLSHFKENGEVLALSPAGKNSLVAGFQKGQPVETRTDGTIEARLDASEGQAERLTATPDGKLWMGGTHLGVLSRHGSALTLQRQPLATDAGNVLSIRYEDRTRRLWSCYGGGLVLRDEQGRWREYTTKNGLRVNGCWSLAPLPDGDVWYAYYVYPGFALIHPRPDGGIQVRNYDRADLEDPNAITFDLDRRGRLWRSSERAIYVADPAQAKAGNWLQLDRSDGFPADDINTGSMYVDTDGSLWWGADNDLEHYWPPDDLTTPKFAPQVFVSAFSWEGQKPKLAEAVKEVPHGVRLVAHIGSLQFDRRNALRVRYRLAGDQPWRETSDLDLPLGTLGAGAHTLEVQGRVYTGPWSTTQRATFNVLSPVWLGVPYLAAYTGLLLLLAVAGFFLNRSRQVDEAQLLPDIASWRLGALTPEVQQLGGVTLDSRFAVGALLARGGFATVMAGYDELRGERCAIKIFRTDVKDKVWMQRGFEQEIAALQKVRHPNVVRITAHGRTLTGAPYLAMEFVEGRSLREVLAQKPLTPARAAAVLEQLSAALAAIHAEKICHRDLKPENILLRREGTRAEQAVLIDFSIAIIKDADETLHGISRAAGTFDYMAPEQAVGHAEPASDIYSLARVLIEMLTGRRLKDLLPGAALDLPRRVTGLLNESPFGLTAESIERVAAALEFDPMRRPSAVGEFTGAIVRDLRLVNAQRTF